MNNIIDGTIVVKSKNGELARNRKSEVKYLKGDNLHYSTLICSLYR